MILARQDAFDVVVVDVERALEVFGGPFRDAHRAVDFFACVAARKPERETTVDRDLASILRHSAACHVHVRVLDDERRLSSAPIHVERAHVLRDERAFDARPPERFRHDARKLGGAADRNWIGSRTEGRHHSGEHAIALLQIGARYMKRNAGVFSPGGTAAERDVGGGRREPPPLELDPIAVEAIRYLSRNRQVTDRRMQDPLLGAAVQAAWRFAREHLRARRRTHFGVTVTLPLAKPAERPGEEVASAPSPREAHAFHLQEVAVGGKVDVLPFGVERGPCRLRAPDWCNRILQLRRTAVKAGRGVGDVEPIGQPREPAL